MNDHPDPSEFAARQAGKLGEFAHQVSQAHGRYLATQRERLANASQLTRQELAALGAGDQPGQTNAQPALVSAAQLREFAEGDIFQCLSPAYRIYAGRRTPRIPNRDLLMMSRITQIEGTPRQVDGSAWIEAEYDVPADAWYLRSGASPDVPFAMLLEIALQPCGYLTAHLETPLAFPSEDFYFRNLDGQASLHRPIRLGGKTILNRSRLLKTSLNAGIIIQKFSFELFCDGQPFFSGQSVFGYFPSASMRSQVGLEGGTRQDPWLETANLAGLTRQPLPISPLDRLNELDEAVIVPGGGRHSRGYLYARRRIDPSAWFFACHFKDDPVMPGSLGIEAAFAALRLFGQAQPGRFAADHYELLPDQELNWKYRGQILPQNGQMELEIHLVDVRTAAGGLELRADATLWVDRTRIYQINGLALRLLS